eukprot:650717-Lingulodinium_polyedra.AAC.1
MHAALAAQAFLLDEALKPAMALPWSLAQGNIEDNLRALVSGPKATEEVTFKVQRLLQHGNNFQEVAAGVALLLQVPWATVSVEQAHASVTLAKRQHP